MRLKTPFLLIFLILCQVSIAQKLDHVLGQLIIVMEPGHQLDKQIPLPFNNTITPLSPSLPLYLLTFDPSRINEYQLLEKIRQSKGVEAVQFNHFLESRTQPNDPYFEHQWAWSYPNQPPVDINLPEVWNRTTGGTTALGDDIVIGILDDGMDWEHEDLKSNLWINHLEIPGNQQDDDDNGYIDDYHGWNVAQENDNTHQGAHGVRVAGVLGAKGNNLKGISGMNWDIELMVVRMENQIESEAIAGYAYLLEQRRTYNETQGDRGAFVVASNTSWGINNMHAHEAPIWCTIFDLLGEAGILNCAATANRNVNIDQVGDIPTSCTSDYLVTVTSIDSLLERPVAGYGPISIDLAAPGVSILTTTAGNQYDYATGTSFATPMVAGLVGLLYASPCSDLIELAKTDPADAALEVKDLILQGTIPTPGLGYATLSGGRLNAARSMALLETPCLSCTSVEGLNASWEGNQVLIQWNSIINVPNSKLRWRVVGTNQWQELETPAAQVAFDNWSPCSAYEISLQHLCQTGNGQIETIALAAQHGIDVSWEVRELRENEVSLVANAESFEPVHILVLDQMDTIFNQRISSSPINIPNLLPCTNYSLWTKADCTESAFSHQFDFQTLGCGACLDQAYCPSRGSSNSSEWIDRVHFGDIDQQSGFNSGYGNFTTVSTSLIVGQKYKLELRPGFDGLPHKEYFRAWIDYNQNGSFEEEELIFDPLYASEYQVSDSIEIPEGVLLGSTRMRISMSFLPFGVSPPEGCTPLIEFGEVEDYCVDIIADFPSGCESVEEVILSEVGSEHILLDWNQSLDIGQYQIQYRKSGYSDWEVVRGIARPMEVAGLDACSSYEIAIQRICAFGTAEYSNPVQFTTDCLNSIREIEQQFQVYPNPFAQEIILDLDNSFTGSLNIELINELGQIVQSWQESTEGAERNIHLVIEENLPTRIYWLKIRTEEGEYIKKLIKR